MRFTVSGTWRRRRVEVMWEDGFIQAPRDLLLDLHLRAMLDGPSQDGAPIPPVTLLGHLREALDVVDGVWADDGHPMLEIRVPERAAANSGVPRRGRLHEQPSAL